MEIFVSFILLFFFLGGYLNSKEITVEAVLTKAGREKLANGNSLNITRFALADDEIDYNLYRPDHPGGSEFASDIILNQPLFEAFVDETQVMRHKLVSLPRDTERMPQITVSSESIILQGSGDQAEIRPITQNGSNDTLGFTAVIEDAGIANVGVAQGGAVETTTGTIPQFLVGEDEARTDTAIGRRFIVTGRTVSETQSTRLVIFGNETGGSVTIEIVVESVN